MKNTKVKGALCALLSGSLYGIIPIVLLNVSRSGEVPGTLCNMYRQFFGSIILVVPAILRIRKLKMSGRALLRLLWVAMSGGLVTLTLYEAFDRLPSGVVITLHYLYPVFTLLLSVLLFKQKPPRGAAVAVVLAFTGVVLLCDLSLMPEKPALGIVLAVLSGFLCASWLILIDKTKLGETDTTVYTYANLAGPALVLFLYNLIRGKLSCAFSAPQWGSLVLAGVCALFAVMMLGLGIRFAGPVIASVLSAMEPIVCTLGSALVLGDPLTPRMLLGVVLVLGGVVLLTLLTGREEKAPAPER